MEQSAIELKDIPAEEKQANFEAVLRQVVKVPKSELDARIKAGKEERKAEREKKKVAP
ncbi:MAG TPA: hypothetical protein VFA07_08210 [Chthonomonadaceae bacterium]|nr:hypothetical protein [Chthonomonadaceae bacterium]